MLQRLVIGLQSDTDAAAVVDMLTSLFELINCRSVYLYCLNGTASQAAASNRPSVPSAAATAVGLFHSLFVLEMIIIMMLID